MIFSTISELNVASIEPIFLAACTGLTNKVFFLYETLPGFTTVVAGEGLKEA